MRIRALAENTSIYEEYESEHGLSLFIETAKRKLLFDMGRSDLYLRNAHKMGIDIAEVDTAFLSHGHHDHGGGLKSFLEENPKAPVYIHNKAFAKHFSRHPNGNLASIGLDESLKDDKRFVFAGDMLGIDNDLELFSNVQGKELCPQANQRLLMEEGTRFVEDTFAHEQNLIITDSDKTVLIAGCAHNGIVNIVRHFKAMKGFEPDYVIGGFHLFDPITKKSEDSELIHQIGYTLSKTKSKYYTCHCTGLDAFEQLKSVMKDQIQYLAVGTTIEI